VACVIKVASTDLSNGVDAHAEESGTRNLCRI